MIRLETLSRSALLRFIEDPAFLDAKVLPISRLRATSQVNNPAVTDEDVLLILAYEGEDLVGYLGMLPDLLRTSAGLTKCAWMSCLWVDGEQRGRGIASKLVRRAFECWEDMVLATEFTPPARRLYEKTGLFNTLTRQDGIRLYRRLNTAEILPNKHRLFASRRRELKWLDTFGNFILHLLPSTGRRTEITSTFVPINEIEPDMFKDAENMNGSLFPISADRVEWLLNYPWLTSNKAVKSEDEKYYFSLYAEAYSSKAYYSRKHNLLVVITVRNGHLKVPYVSVPRKHLFAAIATFILGKFREYNCHTLTIYHPNLVEFMTKNKTGSIYKKPVYREYLCSSKISRMISSNAFYIADGAGDCAFT